MLSSQNRISIQLIEMSGWSGGQVLGAQLLSGRANNSVGQGVFQLGVVELSGGHTLAIRRLNSGGADDLNRLESRAMTTSHIIVEGIDSSIEAHVSVLAVHIVCAASRVILDPNTIVLDVVGVLFSNFVNIKDLASRLLHLAHLMHEVPKAGLGIHFIRSEELHAINLGRFIVRGWGLAADNLEKAHLSWHG